MAIVQKKTVLITGCSTGGIGWALAKTFLARDFHVFATARDISTTGNLDTLSNVEILELDVTKPQTILRCKETIRDRTGGRLDVLINNAGVEFVSPLLDVDIAEAKRLYDVNVWGPVAMVQAFAPLLIEAQGVVVNQSSINAELSIVWARVFASSKAAAAKLSETLRHELAPLGVRVVTVMCGSVDTPMFDKPGGQLRLPETSYYYHVQDAANKERSDHQGKAMKVEALADKLVNVILEGTKGLVWYGALASIVRLVTWANMTWFVDRMVNAERGVSKVQRI
nr:short-chain dehydrogenase cctt [Quercus suber]